MKLVSVVTPEKDVCKMTFSATAEELNAAAEAVYVRQRADITIEGHEKGAATRAEIEAVNGEKFFWYDAINDLMNRDVPPIYEQVLAERKLTPVDVPAYDLVNADAQEGFTATAVVCIEPELTIGRYTGFTARQLPNPVTEKEIDHFIERRRAALAELVPHRGPAVKGNVVHVSYVGFLPGSGAFAGGQGTNVEIALGAGRMIPGFEEGILGHKAGDSFEIPVTFPANYSDAALAGKKATFNAKLTDVCVRQLPALNSAFAKKAGGVDSMEAYRAVVRTQLEQMKKQNAVNFARTAVLDQLADETKGELPHQLTDRQYFAELQQFQQELARMQKKLEVYLAQVHQTQEQLLAQLRESAARKVRVHIALLKIARMEKLEPTEADITAELEVQAKRAGKTPEEYLELEDRAAISRRLAAGRAAEYVIGHSTIITE